MLDFITNRDFGISDDIIGLEIDSVSEIQAIHNITNSKVRKLQDFGLDLEEIANFSEEAQYFFVNAKIAILAILTDIGTTVSSVSRACESNKILNKVFRYAQVDNIKILIEKFNIDCIEGLSNFIDSEGVYLFLKSAYDEDWELIEKIYNAHGIVKQEEKKVVLEYYFKFGGKYFFDKEIFQLFTQFIQEDNFISFINKISSIPEIKSIRRIPVETLKTSMEKLHIKSEEDFIFFMKLPNLEHLIERNSGIVFENILHYFSFNTVKELLDFCSKAKVASWITSYGYFLGDLTFFTDENDFLEHLNRNSRTMKQGINEMNIYMHVFGLTKKEVFNMCSKYHLLTRLNSENFSNFSEKLSLLQIKNINDFIGFISPDFVKDNQYYLRYVSRFLYSDISIEKIKKLMSFTGVSSYSDLLKNEKLYKLFALDESILNLIYGDHLGTSSNVLDYSFDELSFLLADHQIKINRAFINKFGFPCKKSIKLFYNIGSAKIEALNSYFKDSSDYLSFVGWRNASEFLALSFNKKVLTFFSQTFGIKGIKGLKKIYKSKLLIDLFKSDFPLEELKKFIKYFGIKDYSVLEKVDNIQNVLFLFKNNISIDKVKKTLGIESITIELLSDICSSPVIVNLLRRGVKQSIKDILEAEYQKSIGVTLNGKESQGHCSYNESTNTPILNGKSKKFILIEVGDRIIGHIKLKGEKSFFSYVDLADKDGNIVLIKGGLYTLDNYSDITSHKINPVPGVYFTWRFDEDSVADFNFLRMSNIKKLDEKLYYHQLRLLGNEKRYIN